MSKNLFFFVTFLLLSSSAFAVTPFRTDGCTGYFNGTLIDKDLWLDCCVEHDFYYWIGGTKVKRMLADKRLRQCVAAVGPVNAWIMETGVILGDKTPNFIRKLSPVDTSGMQWGNGLNVPKMDRPVTEAELKMFKDEISKSRFPKSIKSRFLNYLSKGGSLTDDCSVLGSDSSELIHQP